MNGVTSESPTGDRRGWILLAAALAAGVAADLLFRDAPAAGINLPLWAGALTAAAAALARAWGVPVAADGLRLALAALALTTGFAWRDDATLWTLDAFLLLLTVPLALHALHRGELRRAHLADYAYGLVAGATEMAAAPFVLLARDVSWRELPRGRGFALAGAVLRGALLAAPVLLVFGTLFVLADPVFSRLVADAMDVDAAELLARAFSIGFFAAAAAAVLRPALRGPAVAPPGLPDAVANPAARLPMPVGPTEVATALSLLNLLFLAFVAVQLRFLFGDEEFVRRTAGLTFAAYARQGFFQLVVAAGLVVPTLLAAHWLLLREPRAQRTFRLLAGTLLVQVGVILASAMHRLRLYYLAYGLTEARLYAAACLLWVAAVLAWLAATVLRGRRERFAWGALLAAYAVTALLHVADPDALVARANLAHYRRTGRYDPLYGLGPGAVPVLVSALDALPPDARGRVAGVILHDWSYPPRDWRSWNWARARAAAVVAEHREVLEQAAQEAP